MILAVRKGGTKFGLQPFQNLLYLRLAIYDLRRPGLAWGPDAPCFWCFFNSFLLASLGQYFTVEPREWRSARIVRDRHAPGLLAQGLQN